MSHFLDSHTEPLGSRSEFPTPPSRPPAVTADLEAAAAKCELNGLPWCAFACERGAAEIRSLAARVALLEKAIRRHRNWRGDDRCWLDDEELYRVLPEGYTPPPRDASVELALCERYIACRHNPATEYVSPQRRIEELEAETARLRASQSDQLARNASRKEEDP